MQAERMNLKILLPFRVFAEKSGVSRIVAQTRSGSFGLLPHRLDCAAALAPGILVFATDAEGEVCLAVDEGILVKTGAEGVYCAVLPELRLGVAIKIDDGARRAAEFVTARLLQRLGVIDGDAAYQLRDALDPVIANRTGAPVGTIRAAESIES